MFSPYFLQHDHDGKWRRAKCGNSFAPSFIQHTPSSLFFDLGPVYTYNAQNGMINPFFISDTFFQYHSGYTLASLPAGATIPSFHQHNVRHSLLLVALGGGGTLAMPSYHAHKMNDNPFSRIDLIITAGVLTLFLGLYVMYKNQEIIPFVDRSHFIFFGREFEDFLGDMVKNQMLNEDAKQRLLPASDPRTKLVNSVGKRITDITPLPGVKWEFFVFDSPQINAFCSPGGKIFVYTGLINLCQALQKKAGPVETSLAIVMGHEVAHALAKHVVEKLSMSGLIMFLNLLTTGSPLLELGFRYGLELPYSRTQETEADKLGMILCAIAGFDIDSAPQFWKAWGEVDDHMSFLATHPSHADRHLHTMEYLPTAKAIAQEHLAKQPEPPLPWYKDVWNFFA